MREGEDRNAMGGAMGRGLENRNKSGRRGIKPFKNLKCYERQKLIQQFSKERGEQLDLSHYSLCSLCIYECINARERRVNSWVRNFRFFPEYFPPSSNIHFLLHCSSLDSSLW